MRFKLDENFGTRTQRLFRDAGHDAATVREEELLGASDHSIYDMCCEQHRCLVTLDLDFANAGQFPPEQTEGLWSFAFPETRPWPYWSSSSSNCWLRCPACRWSSSFGS